VSTSLPLASRRTGRLLAALGALVSLGIAISTAISESDRVLRIYDGLWMLLGAAVAVAAVTPFIRRWPRERALFALAITVTAGTWLPLVILALRGGMPIGRRIRGAIFWAGADIIGLAVPVGVLFAWLALQEHRPAPKSPASPEV
jgi:drug/metabolite transporter (DMT)-like permease